ncbi:MAG: hypothetical protein ABI693_21815 [Bryobacteraceae bacterium]
MRVIPLLLAVTLLLAGGEKKLTDEERLEMVRNLTAEFATAKVMLPRSHKPLEFPSTGAYDKAQWMEAAKELGPAARVGDQVQVTKINIEDDRIVFEINGGLKTKKKWYEHVEVGGGGGGGGGTRPIGRTDGALATGTYIALTFPKGVPAIEAAAIKKMLAPVLDFDKHSATENYVDNLPEPIREAIKNKKVIEGMDREQVLLAAGRPRDKLRETRDGVDFEDWIFGLPPGRITFVTFKGKSVVTVKETYAGLGGSTAPPLKPQ